MQTNPLHSRNISHITDQVGDVMLSVEVNTIISQLLGYDLELLDALCHHITNLLKDLSLRTAYMFAGDDRDGTIGTMTVAALGYLDISIMTGSGEMAMTITGRNISLAQLAQQLLVVELAVNLSTSGISFSSSF